MEEDGIELNSVVANTQAPYVVVFDTTMAKLAEFEIARKFPTSSLLMRISN